MKRVLVFGMTSNPGGIESVIMNYYRKIDKKKLQFDFLCVSKKIAYEEEIKYLGGKVIKIVSRSENYFKFRKELKHFMKNNASKYDGIWMNVCSLTNIDYLIMAKKYGIKKRIIHCHNSDNDSGKFKLIMHKFNKNRISKYANLFWSCSADASPWFYSKKIQDSNEYKIITNGIDVDLYSPDRIERQRIRKALNLNNKIVLGHVGRFHFQKNHEFLINLFEYICKENDNYRLLLIGQGELEDKISDLIYEKGLEKKVYMLGVRNDVEKIYQGMDVFLLPSKFEGLGLVAIEAQAANLPCVLSDKVPKEVKINDDVEFLPINDNYEQWKNAINDCLSSKKCKSKVRDSKFNINNSIKDFEKEFLI